MKRIVTGILAHVDAGKTTLSESLLYLSGAIRELGRVDHKNTLLDTYEQERARGITIFSKQAVFEAGDTFITLLDTPGHADFAAEMERTLQVLDYAILVISGADGVQGHTSTLWKLLKRYDIPTFIFVNKMDRQGLDKEAIMSELREKLDEHCIEFDIDNFDSDEFRENVAVSDEGLLASFLEDGKITDRDIQILISDRKIFPCYFGSALKLDGVKGFIEGIDRFTVQPSYGKEFGAKVFKITRDGQGNRLTHMKITGGSLSVRTLLSNNNSDVIKNEDIWEEKINQIRVYHGSKFEAVKDAEPGMICAVTGLSKTYSGEGLGAEKASPNPILQPVLTYRLILPEDLDAAQMFPKLKMLEEEEPELDIVWNDKLSEIQVKLMGEVQTEILQRLISERFGIEVSFGAGNIVYKETIKNKVEGVGHYEPLRHYAEVHLIMEAGEAGSGLVFETDCSEDVLDKNWQRLILTHLREKEHVGVLTGSPVTDMKITVAGGRAHLKHTEGGDFRQATYRAVRNGLMKAESVLLEPFYDFILEIPAENAGRALNDMDRLKAVFDTPCIEGDNAVIKGRAPVSLMQGYHTEVTAYSKGHGSLTCEFAGYMECHNSREVMERIGYIPELDMENPAGSVFCAHGAGFAVEWDEVEDYMHVENVLRKEKKEEADDNILPDIMRKSSGMYDRYLSVSYSEDKELQQIFARTYGEKKERKASAAAEYNYNKTAVYKPSVTEKEYLLVDGYNVIHAWDSLHELAERNLESARDALMDILCNYQGYKNYSVILVFDAYKVKGNPGEIIKYHNIDVVYTKEAETADRYIEKTAHEIGGKYKVTVVTSDGVEQVIIRGAGCNLMSSREFKEDVELMKKQINEVLEERKTGKRSYLFDGLDENIKEHLEDVRLGRK